MIKICDYTMNPIRQNFLTDFFGEKVNFLKPLEGDLSEQLKVKTLKTADLTFFTEPQIQWIFKNWTEFPLKYSDSKFADVAMKKPDSGIWLYSSLDSSLIAMIAERNSELDIRRAAYVVGTGVLARPIILELIKLGFKQIRIVTSKKAGGEKVIAGLSQHYFQIELSVLENPQLSIQVNDGSILVNTESLDLQPELAQDLSYLNFISSHGIVIDLGPNFKKSILIEEAENVGLRMLNSVETFTYRDYVVLEQVGLISSDRQSEFISEYREFIYNLERENPGESPVT